MDSVLEWIARQWFEILGVAVTIAALIYAHLAYRVGLLGLEQNRQIELNNFRVLTKAALNDARQAQVSLELTCRIHRASKLAVNKNKRYLSMPSEMEMADKGQSMFLGHPYLDDCFYQGQRILRQLELEYEAVDRMDLSALEILGQRAKAVSLEIQALAGTLQEVA